MRWFRRRSGRGVREAGDADEAFRHALLAVLEQQWEEAERWLAKAAQLDPASVVPYLAIGRLFRSRGEIGRAIQTHHNLLVRSDLSPADRTAALIELGADFRQGGFLQRSVAAYEEVLSHDSNHRDALSALVRLYADLRNFPRALELARKLRKQTGAAERGEEVALLVEMAEAAGSEGREADARKALRRALKLDPRCARAWLALGTLEVERGRNKAALDAWRKVPECDPRSGAEIYPQLEAAFASIGKLQDFEAFLRAHLEAQPDALPARLALSRTLSARGEGERAREEAQAALDMAPDALEAHAVLGRLLLDEQQDAEIAKAYDALLTVLEGSRDVALDGSDA